MTRRMLVVGSIVGVLLAFASVAGAAQSPGLRIRQTHLEPSGEVRVVVSTTGSAADGVLRPEDFEVTEAGTRIEEIRLEPLVESAFQPIAVVLVIDVSGSTAGKPLEDAKAAAKLFVTSVPSPVEIAIVAFGSIAQTKADFTTDRSGTVAAIDALQAGGETALYDAVALSASMLTSRPDHQHNIVVFSDGKDTVSTTSLGDAVKAATDGVAPVTSVALVTADFDPAALQTLSAQTGGTSLDVGASQNLSEAFSQVAKEIASQYVITYTAERVEPKELEIAISVTVDGASARDEVVVINPRTRPAPGKPSHPVVAAPEIPLLAPVGLYLGALLLFVAGGLLVWQLIRPKAGSAMRLLRRAVEEPSQDQQEESDGAFLTSRLAHQAVKLVEHIPKPQGLEQRLQLLLDRAAWPLRASEFLVLQGLGAVGGLMVGAGLFGRVSTALVLSLVGLVLPRTILTRRVERRQNAFMAQLPDTLHLLAGSLQAGHGLMQAIDTAAQEVGPPAGAEFSRVLGETRLGMPLEDALDGVARRIGSEDVGWVLMAINIQRQVGGNLATLFETIAGTLREREQIRRQVKVLSAEGRLSAWVLGLLPFLLAGYMALVNREYLAILFSSGIGRFMIVGALATMGVGVLWMRRIVKIEV